MSKTVIQSDAIKTRPRITRAAMSIAACILFAAVMTILASCGLLPKETDPIQIVLPEPPDITTDTTYPVERADLYNEVDASAFVKPVRSMALYFTQSGRMTVLNV